MKIKELSPIRVVNEDWEDVEARISLLLRDSIYQPMIEILELPERVLQNSIYDLIAAIQRGQVTFHRGAFAGRFNSAISKELRKLGAKWEGGSFRILQSKLPFGVRDAISASEYRFNQKMKKFDEVTAKILPSKIKLQDLYSRKIFKVERQVKDTIDNIVVTPKFSEKDVKRIADEYTNNMQLYIQEWTEKEIVELRHRIGERVLQGQRYEGVIKEIQNSYSVSRNKAKFLARQETNLLMTKIKQVRYQDAGVNEYRWQCVVGSPNHPVRDTHKKLNGKIFRWDQPPIVNEKGDRKNPGQDFGCRCSAIPIVRF